MYKFILIQDGNVYSETTNIIDFDNEITTIILDNNLLSYQKIKETHLITLILLIVNKLDFDITIKKEDK